jgi:hypothetical protein
MTTLLGWLIALQGPQGWPPDAVAVWSMADGNDAAGKNSALAPEGRVELGIALEGEERAASLRRGGDGRIARFDGGSLAGGAGAEGELDLTGKALTLAARLRSPTGKWDAPLASRHGGHARLAWNLYASPTEIGFELGTDTSPRVYRLTAPLKTIGATEWHDVVVRYRGHVLELFVDGVLMDEEWPSGSLRKTVEPFRIGAESDGDRVKAGFHGLVDHVALWSRALADDEIMALSGGRDGAAARERRYLGEMPPTLQYWTPRGHNATAGDCMPFFHDGTFHLYYLFDRRRHGSKLGRGAHQWAHASTRDLVTWTHHPIALPITDEREASICTGSIIFHDGVYTAYYSTRMIDGEERLAFATSRDSIRFEKAAIDAFPRKWEGYTAKDFRDPEVFRADGLFHMFISTREESSGRGCVGHLTSTDLRAWTAGPPVFVGGRGVPECTNHFTMNGWNYLLSNQFRRSRERVGPWESMTPDTLDSLAVPKTAAWKDGRRIYAGWLSSGGFGGCIVFREIVQHPDGLLGTKFPPEMVPARGEPARPSFDLKVSGEHTAEGLPRNAWFRARVKPSAGTFGVRLGAGRAGELRILPGQRRVEIGARAVAAHVDGLDRSFTIEGVAKDDLLDICIDDRRTLIGRIAADGRWTFFAEGEAAFEGLEVRPLR